jgi:NAD(P)-dependent dehydrogenase (short-subunit alcohol dehydrogenase family)
VRADSEIPVALVTGGAQGIGKRIVLHLLERGMRVILADVDAEAGKDAEVGLRSKGPVFFVETDVGQEESVANCLRQTREAFGRIDALVNNAGIAEPFNGPIESLPIERWERVIRTNLTGCFLMAKHAAPHLRSTGGSVVNIASTRALQSEPHTEAYAASKGGLVALTHALAVSLGPEVRVNCISPGWIDVRAWRKGSSPAPGDLPREDHEQHPVGRVGRPEDIGALVAFLLSAEAGFITGQNFVVDGGMTRKMIYRD